MNYEEMSDFEINVAVAENHLMLFVDLAKSKGKLDSDVWLVDSFGSLMWTNYNPCHDPKHAWPIIVDNDITVRGGGIAFIERNNLDIPAYISRDENPLRAAMICFLKMKDSQHD